MSKQGRHRHQRHHRSSHVRQGSRRGWGANLYRDPERGKIAGVCAGLAGHFDIDPWVMRLIFIGAFVFMGGLIVVGYLLAWWLLDPMPEQPPPADDLEYDEVQREYRPKKVFRYSAAASERVHRAQQRMDEIQRRIERMERYVTSRKYKLNDEFADMAN